MLGKISAVITIEDVEKSRFDCGTLEVPEIFTDAISDAIVLFNMFNFVIVETRLNSNLVR